MLILDGEQAKEDIQARWAARARAIRARLDHWRLLVLQLIVGGAALATSPSLAGSGTSSGMIIHQNSVSIIGTYPTPNGTDSPSVSKFLDTAFGKNSTITTNGGYVYYTVPATWSGTSPSYGNYNVSLTVTNGGKSTNMSVPITLSPLCSSGIGAATFDSSILGNPAYNLNSVEQTSSGPRQTAGKLAYNHTPYGGDFGSSSWEDPSNSHVWKDLPGGGFSITDYHDSKGWHSGGLSSVWPDGSGFQQQYGYWEWKAQTPAPISGNTSGSLTPGLWLNGFAPQPSHVPMEFDVHESFNLFPNTWNWGLASWPNSGSSQIHSHYGGTNSPSSWNGFPPVNASSFFDSPRPTIYNAYHTYGIGITPTQVTVYFDGQRYFSMTTPSWYSAPSYTAAQLQTGNGWPNPDTTTPATLNIQYIKAWPLPSSGLCQ
ncbi:MAG: glycoside hydrolase family 16 protein [Acetobacteraceae bacterium]|nr:glycoside hydrolase family 16 protein [Acetobacteraceae bacterium]